MRPPDLHLTDGTSIYSIPLKLAPLEALARIEGGCCPDCGHRLERGPETDKAVCPRTGVRYELDNRRLIAYAPLRSTPTSTPD